MTIRITLEGVEIATAEDQLESQAVDITNYPCIEVDFAEDLGAALAIF